MRSRRLALVAAVAVLGLTACGDAKPSTTAGKAPAVIHVGGAGGATTPGVAGASIATGDRMMAPWADITYVYDGAFPDLGASAAGWVLAANPQIDTARLSTIAGTLGITDTSVRTLTAEQGGGWQVGSADYTGASLNASTDAMGSWWFNGNPATVSNTTPACAVAVPPVAVDTNGAPAAVPTTIACPAPQPPANVPTKDDALARAKQQFQAMGYDVSTYEWESYADEWGASANGYLLLGGHRTMVTLSIGFGGEGVVTWANGTLATPQPAGDYPLVDGAAALARLNDRTGKWGWFGGPAVMARGGVAIDAVASVAGTSGSSDPVTTSGTGGGSDVAPTPVPVPSAVPGVPVATMPVAPVPAPGETLPAPEPVTISLNSMKLDLTSVWSNDGTVYLVPAYTFGAADGSVYTIVSVDETYLDLPDPAPVDTTPVVTAVPLPVDTGAGSTGTVVMPTIEGAASALVGLTLEEATKVAEGYGWTVRVSTLDGQSQMVTLDFQTNRIDVAVTAGTVTGVDNIG